MKRMSKERKVALQVVYETAKRQPRWHYKKISEVAGTEYPCGRLGYIIKGARIGKTFEECLIKYKGSHRHNLKASICEYSDLQLKEELVRRGWEVICKRTTIEEL